MKNPNKHYKHHSTSKSITKKSLPDLFSVLFVFSLKTQVFVVARCDGATVELFVVARCDRTTVELFMVARCDGTTAELFVVARCDGTTEECKEPSLTSSIFPSFVLGTKFVNWKVETRPTID